MSTSFVLRLATAILIAAACCLPARAQAADRERLVIGISQFPSTLHPSFDSMQAKEYINAMARRKITIFDHDWNVVCLLCTGLPDLDKGSARFEKTPDGGDGMALDYQLDDRAVWGDGTPITTKDVLFTWEVGRHPEAGTDSSELYRRILSIDVHDDRRFTLHMDRRSCDYKGLAEFNLLPAHLESAVFEPAADYRKRTLYDRDPSNPGLWYGPYRVTEVNPGASIVLEPNPLWWGKKPYFKQIVVRTIENTAALVANLLAGDIDMIEGEPGLSIDQALSFERRHGDDYQVIYKPGLIYEHLDVALSNPILSDVRVRRALLHGIDRQAISERLFDGKQPVANGQTNPLDSVYFDGAPKYAYDPDKAAALLDEAGWKPGAEGIRRNAEGTPLQFDLMTTAGNKSRELVQQVLQSQWKALGVDATIRNEPARVFFGETVSKRQFTGLAMFAWISSPQSIPRTSLHSTMIPTEENAWAGQNYTGYASEKMDKILDDLELVCDADANRKLWEDMQTLYAQDLPALPLYFRASSYILPKWLKGVRPTGHQYTSTNWIEEWTAAE
ncbi:peptide ABC transporter substrate-binding protein [Hwanghaeella sp.]|uniref:peptide ABC transporter substrate-binding protein n=1 Tax=Hwanghaeella sp. TaxID=2605943 RepID=UPI003CCC118F